MSTCGPAGLGEGSGFPHASIAFILRVLKRIEKGCGVVVDSATLGAKTKCSGGTSSPDVLEEVTL